MQSNDKTSVKGNVMRNSVWIGIVAAVAVSFGAVSAAPVVVKPGSRPAPTCGNPHLRLPASPGPAPKVTSSTVRLTPKAWTPRADPHVVISQQRTLGTIAGVVRDVSGATVSGARVALRKPGGRFFARPSMKHVTYTGPNGTFVMKGVKPGEYRVFAELLKRHGFVKHAVESGRTLHVAIKI